MKTYTIYFELFDRKMKTSVEAKSKEQAKQILKDKIIFHKIEGVNDGVSEGVKKDKIKNFDLDGLKDFLGIT